MVWYGVDPKDLDYEIYLYEASTGDIRPLTDNTTYDYDPQISDNRDVAWSGYDSTQTLRYIFMMLQLQK